MNRRNFLKTTAAGAAVLPTFSILHAEEGVIGPADDQLNIAIIGYGAEGEILTDDCVKIPGIRIRALCDIWEVRRKMAKGRLRALGHNINIYEDYREMLDKEDKNIDAVVVATPDWMHAEHACYCLRKGKPVYCEKEMSNQLSRAREMVLAARETGLPLQIGHQRRSNPRYMHAINTVMRENRVLGRITHAYAQWNRSVAPFTTIKSSRLNIPIETLQKYGYENMEQFLNWRWFAKYGGGPMVDLGSHQIDLFFWVWDCAPIAVTAVGGNDYYNRQMNDNVMAIYQFKTKEGLINRAFYQVLTTSSRGGFYEQFMGEDGYLTLSEISARGNTAAPEPGKDWTRFTKMGILNESKTPVPLAVERSNDISLDSRVTKAAAGLPLPVELVKPAHMPHLENFFLAVRRKDAKLLNCDAELAYESAVAVLAANRSVAEGKTIYFKPEDFKVPADAKHDPAKAMGEQPKNA
ncbi:MAG: Gfo/Idh/MocA family oxidoreductase [Kiritimatiellae bacterium]|nr:Gfo/Idh/MocA family oxidoreductase [Kiritimatiellia bacterium]